MQNIQYCTMRADMCVIKEASSRFLLNFYTETKKHIMQLEFTVEYIDCYLTLYDDYKYFDLASSFCKKCVSLPVLCLTQNYITRQREQFITTFTQYKPTVGDK